MCEVTVWPSGADIRGVLFPADPHRGCHEGGQHGQTGPAGLWEQNRAPQCRVPQVRQLCASSQG